MQIIIEPKIIGYSHWFEVPENAPYGDGMPDYRVNPSNNPVRSIDLSVAGLLHNKSVVSIQIG